MKWETRCVSTVSSKTNIALLGIVARALCYNVDEWLTDIYISWLTDIYISWLTDIYISWLTDIYISYHCTWCKGSDWWLEGTDGWHDIIQLILRQRYRRGAGLNTPFGGFYFLSVAYHSLTLFIEYSMYSMVRNIQRKFYVRCVIIGVTK